MDDLDELLRSTAPATSAGSPAVLDEIGRLSEASRAEAAGAVGRRPGERRIRRAGVTAVLAAALGGLALGAGGMAAATAHVPGGLAGASSSPKTSERPLSLKLEDIVVAQDADGSDPAVAEALAAGRRVVYDTWVVGTGDRARTVTVEENCQRLVFEVVRDGGGDLVDVTLLTDIEPGLAPGPAHEQLIRDAKLLTAEDFPAKCAGAGE